MNETSIPPSPDLARKNRTLLLILLASFVIPFVIGDVAYKFGWYKGGQTNKGQLIDPPASFADLRALDVHGNPLASTFASKQWWLLYVVPAECDKACHNRLFQMRQVRKALGKEGARIRQVLVFTSAPSGALEELLKAEFADFARITADAVAVDQALQRAVPAASKAGQLYVMDPLGWIMLAYAPEADEKASVVKAEDILQDLQKMLKASRIG